ncbi:MAG: ribosome biogenesis GTPase Der, partial [Gammaproteobacteria bacterium]|nr:ribosome biogenesis GTPase Der [Gammaproteobacteria bacterium]
NVLTKRRDALVSNFSGLTRDRQFGTGLVGSCDYLLIDTGGLNDGDEDEMAPLVSRQALLAVEEADSVLFLVDGRAGLTALDEAIAESLRRFNTKIHLVINKSEGRDEALISSEFHALGLGLCHPISAAHKHGIKSLMDAVLQECGSKNPDTGTASHDEQAGREDPDSAIHGNSDKLKERIKVAIIGRPNVGKSTLVNRILGEERQLTFDKPGTTRDSIAIPFERQGQKYTLIDTAGIRRRAKVSETVEKFSIIKAMQAIKDAHVAVMLFDAREGMTDQDAGLLGFILESGRALVLAVNKWDGLSDAQRKQARNSLDRKLHFIDYAKPHFISALHGSGVGNLFGTINEAWGSACRHVNTSRLNRILSDAVFAHPPPLVRGRRIKLRYAHQGGHNPPLFVVHGNQIKALPDAYRRYLANTFREELQLTGTPVRVQFKQGDNPYKNRKNTLNPRQIEKRRRLMRHAK